MAARRDLDQQRRDIPYEFADQGLRMRDNESIGYNVNQSQSSSFVVGVANEGTGYQTMNVGTAGGDGVQDASLQRVLHLVQQQYKALNQQKSQGRSSASYSAESECQAVGSLGASEPATWSQGDIPGLGGQPGRAESGVRPRAQQAPRQSLEASGENSQYEQQQPQRGRQHEQSGVRPRAQQAPHQSLEASGENLQYDQQQPQRGRPHEQSIAHGAQEDTGKQAVLDSVNQMAAQMQWPQLAGLAANPSQADVIQQQKSLIEKQLVTGNVDPTTMIQLGEMHQKLCQLQRSLQQEQTPGGAAQTKSNNRNVNRNTGATTGKGQTKTQAQRPQWQQQYQQTQSYDEEEATRQRNRQLIYQLHEQYDQTDVQKPQWQGNEQSMTEQQTLRSGVKRSQSPYYATEQRGLDAQDGTFAETAKRRRQMSPRYDTSPQQKYTDSWQGEQYPHNQTETSQCREDEEGGDKHGWPGDSDTKIEGQLKEMRARTSSQSHDTRVVHVADYDTESWDLPDADREKSREKDDWGRKSDVDSDDELSQLEAARKMKDRLEKRLRSGKISVDNERKYRDMYFDLSEQINLLEKGSYEDDYDEQDDRSPDEYFYEYKDERGRRRHRSYSKERRRGSDDDHGSSRRHYDDRDSHERGRRRSSSPRHRRSRRRGSRGRRSSRSSERKSERRERQRRERSVSPQSDWRSESSYSRDAKARDDGYRSKADGYQPGHRSSTPGDLMNQYFMSSSSSAVSSHVPPHAQYGTALNQPIERGQQQMQPLQQQQPQHVSNQPPQTVGPPWQGYHQPSQPTPVQPVQASYPGQPQPPGVPSPAPSYVPTPPAQPPYQVGYQTTISVNYQYQGGGPPAGYQYQYSSFNQSTPVSPPSHAQWRPAAPNRPAIRPAGPPSVQSQLPPKPSPPDREALQRKEANRLNLVDVTMSTQIAPKITTKRPPAQFQPKSGATPVLIDVQKLQDEKEHAQAVHTRSENLTQAKNEDEEVSKTRKEKRKTLLSSKSSIMTDEMIILAPNVEERLKKVFSYNHLYSKFCLVCCEKVTETVNQPVHVELERHKEMQSVFQQFAEMWGIIKEFGKREKESRAEVLKKSKIIEKKLVNSKPGSEQCQICSVDIKDKQEYENHVSTLRHQVLQHMCEIVMKVKRAVLRKDMDAIENLLQEEKDKVSDSESTQCKLCGVKFRSDEDYEKHTVLPTHLARKACIDIIMDALQHLIKSTLVINIKRIPASPADQAKKSKAKATNAVEKQASSSKDSKESKSPQPKAQVAKTSSGQAPKAGISAQKQKVDVPEEFTTMSLEEKLEKIYASSQGQKFCLICQEFLPKILKQATHAKHNKHRSIWDFFQMLIKMGGFIEDFSKPAKRAVLETEMANIRDMLDKGVSSTKLYCGICRTSLTDQERLKIHAAEVKHRLLQATYEVVLKVDAAVEKRDASVIADLVKSYEKVSKLCKDPVRRSFIAPITRSLKLLLDSHVVKSMACEESQEEPDQEMEDVAGSGDSGREDEDTEAGSADGKSREDVEMEVQPSSDGASRSDTDATPMDIDTSEMTSVQTLAENYQSQFESVREKIRKVFTYQQGERYCLICCIQTDSKITKEEHLKTKNHKKMLNLVDNISQMKKIMEDLCKPGQNEEALLAAKKMEARLDDPRKHYCAVCSEELKRQNYNSHMSSVEHKQMRGITEVVAIVRNAVENDDMMEIESLLQTYTEKLNVREVGNKSSFCSLCDYDCINNDAYEEHITSYHHFIGTLCKDAIMQGLHYHRQYNLAKRRRTELPESEYMPSPTIEERLKKTFTYQLGDRYCLICCEKVPEILTHAKHLSLVQHKQMHNMFDCFLKIGAIIEDFFRPGKKESALSRSVQYEKRLSGGGKQHKYYCAVCRVSCSGVKAAKVYSIHMKTIGHEQTKEMCETLVRVKEAVMENDLSAVENLKETYEDQFVSEETEEGPWFCLLCNLEYEEQSLYKQHLCDSRLHGIRKICRGSILHVLQKYCGGAVTEVEGKAEVKALATARPAPRDDGESSQPIKEKPRDASQPIKAQESRVKTQTGTVAPDTRVSGDTARPIKTPESKTRKPVAAVTSDTRASGDTVQPIKSEDIKTPVPAVIVTSVSETKTSDATTQKRHHSESSVVSERQVVLKEESRRDKLDPKPAPGKPHVEYLATQSLEERLKKTFTYKLGDRYCLICCEKVPENITPVKHVRFFRHTQMRGMLERISNMGAIIEDLSKSVKKEDALERAKKLEEVLETGANRTDYHCAACRETCSGKQTYDIHMKSIGHEQITEASSAVIKVKNAVQEKDMQQIDVLVQEYEEKVKMACDKNRPWFCLVCSLTCKDKSAYDLHMSKSRHHMIRRVCKERILCSLQSVSQRPTPAPKTEAVKEETSSSETERPVASSSGKPEETPKKEKPSIARQRYEDAMIDIFKRTMPKLSRYYQSIFDDTLALLQAVADLAQPSLKAAAWTKIQNIERNLARGLHIEQGLPMGKCFICSKKNVSRKEARQHKEGRKHIRLRQISEIVMEVKKIMEKNDIRKIIQLKKIYEDKLYARSSAEDFWLCAKCDLFCDNKTNFNEHLREPAHTLSHGCLKVVVNTLRYLYAELSSNVPALPSTSSSQSQEVPMLPMATRLQKTFVYNLGERYCLLCCEIVPSKIDFKDHITCTRHKIIQHTFSRVFAMGRIIEEFAQATTRSNSDKAASDVKDAIEVGKSKEGACRICHAEAVSKEKCDELHMAGLMHYRLQFACQSVVMVTEAVRSGDMTKIGDWLKVQDEPVMQKTCEDDGTSKLKCRICLIELKTQDAFQNHVTSSLHIATKVCVDTITSAVTSLYKSEDVEKVTRRGEIPDVGKRGIANTEADGTRSDRDAESEQMVQECPEGKQGTQKAVRNSAKDTEDTVKGITMELVVIDDIEQKRDGCDHQQGTHDAETEHQDDKFIGDDNCDTKRESDDDEDTGDCMDVDDENAAFTAGELEDVSDDETSVLGSVATDEKEELGSDEEVEDVAMVDDIRDARKDSHENSDTKHVERSTLDDGLRSTSCDQEEVTVSTKPEHLLNESLMVTLDEICDDDDVDDNDSGNIEEEIEEEHHNEDDMDFDSIMASFIVTDEVGEDT